MAFRALLGKNSYLYYISCLFFFLRSYFGFLSYGNSQHLSLSLLSYCAVFLVHYFFWVPFLGKSVGAQNVSNIPPKLARFTLFSFLDLNKPGGLFTNWHFLKLTPLLPLKIFGGEPYTFTLFNNAPFLFFQLFISNHGFTVHYLHPDFSLLIGNQEIVLFWYYWGKNPTPLKALLFRRTFSGNRFFLEVQKNRFWRIFFYKDVEMENKKKNKVAIKKVA